MSRLLFAADLHGNRYAYENAFNLVRDKDVDAVVLGGDLTPKKVAIKLEDKKPIEIDDESEPIPGKVLPVELLVEDDETGTFTQGLEKIKQLNTERSSEELARDLESQGCIIYPARTAFYDLEDMLDENVVIDRLFSFFRSNGGVRRHLQPLQFSELQLGALEDVILPALRKIEDEKSEGHKKSLAKRWNLNLNDLRSKKGDYPFERLAPGSTFLNYVLFREKLQEIEEQHSRLSGAINSPDEEVSDYFRKTIDGAILDVQIARKMAEIFEEVDLFKGLGGYTSVSGLRDEASSHEVFVQGQRQFINSYLRNLLRQFRQRTGKEVYGILGNDDLREVEEDVGRLDAVENLIGYMNMQTVELDSGLWIAGYPFVRTSNGSFYRGWEKPEADIKKELDKLALQSDPRRTVYVTHSPPHGGNLDIAYNNEHIGSESVRKFIEKYQPLAVLSGHVHESFLRSGQIMERIGETYVFNPGGEHGRDRLCAVIVDTDDIGNYERIYG